MRCKCIQSKSVNANNYKQDNIINLSIIDNAPSDQLPKEKSISPYTKP